MKNYILLIAFLFITTFCFSQTKYKKVDTLAQYENAQIVIYKNKFHKPQQDTIWNDKQTSGIHISYVDVVISYDYKLKRKK